MKWRFDRDLLTRVWQLAWPTVLWSLLDSLVGLVDVYMVSRLGKDAIAAVGFSLQILMVIQVGALAFSTGTITLVAQFTGAGNRRDAGRVAGQAIFSMFFLGIGLGLIGAFFSQWLLEIMGARPTVLLQAAPYLRLIMAGGPFFLANFAVAAVFRGAGDTVTPLKIASVINVLNIIGNYVFIFGVGPIPSFGVGGAAMGTIIARSLGVTIGTGLLLSGRYRAWCTFDHETGWLDIPLVRRMLAIGWPAALQGFFRNGGRVVFFKIVAGSAFAADVIPALTVGSRIRMFTVMPSLAFQVAAAALVGQGIGAKKTKEAEGYGWETMKLCTAVMVVVAAFQWIFSRQIIAVFTDSPEVRDLGAALLKYFAAGEVFSSLAITASGGLVGAGDTRPALYYTIISQWLLMLPLAWALMHMGLDPVGAWVAWFMAPIVQAVLTVQRFRSGKWQHIRV